MLDQKKNISFASPSENIDLTYQMDKNVNKGISTEFDSVGICETPYKTPPESTLGKASFSGKIQNGRQ